MHAFPTTRRHWAWLTAMVILLASFAPAMSAWVAHASGTRVMWQEVCTAREARKVTVIVYQAKGQTESGDHMSQGHCPLCMLQAHAVALPPPDGLALVLLPIASHEAPALFLHASHTLHAWATAQARAPPIGA